MNKKAKITLITTWLLILLLAISLVAAPPPQKECRDGIDNDCDDAIDWPNDAGCVNKNDNDETNCGDGVCEGGETTASCPVDCPPPTTTTTTTTTSSTTVPAGNQTNSTG